MKLTLSVRSFQVPPTPFTCAWPPSFPSVPTSRATRVTSDAKDDSWSTIVLMVFLSSRISPLTSTVIFFERSPFATAVVTSAMLRTWLVRLDAMKLTLSVRSFHVPATPLTCAWPPSFPSVPTSRATRVTSDAKVDSWSTIVFTIFAGRRNSPVSGRPSISRDRKCVDVADLVGEVGGHEVDVIGKIFPGTGHALHLRLTAEFSFSTDFARHARHLRRKG